MLYKTFKSRLEHNKFFISLSIYFIIFKLFYLDYHLSTLSCICQQYWHLYLQFEHPWTQIYIPNSLFDISSQMSHEHLKYNVSILFSISDNRDSIFPILQAINFGVILGSCTFLSLQNYFVKSGQFHLRNWPTQTLLPMSKPRFSPAGFQ